jgi:RNA polymerase sigma-70 factor (ECF subfamily)
VVIDLFVAPGIPVRRHWRLGPAVSTRDDEFEQFFLDNYAAVLHILVLITGDRERATDAAQEAFIKAHAKWSKIRRYDSPIAWVRRVAINASHDSFRKDRRRRRREEATPLVAEGAQPDRYASDDAAAQLLMELPDRQREVATLFYVDDRSVAEIAAILGLNDGTVKSHLSSARDHLRRIVDRDGAEP